MPDVLTAITKGLNLAARIGEEDRLRREERAFQLQDVESARGFDIDQLNRQAAIRAQEQATDIEGRVGIQELVGEQAQSRLLTDVASRKEQQLLAGRQATERTELAQRLRDESPLTAAQTELLRAQTGAVSTGPLFGLAETAIRQGFVPESGRFEFPEESGLPALTGLNAQQRGELAYQTQQFNILREQRQALEAVADELGLSIAEVADRMADDPKFFKQHGRGPLGIGGLFGATKPSEFAEIFGSEADPFISRLMGMKDEAIARLFAIGIAGTPTPGGGGPLRETAEVGEEPPPGPGPLLNPQPSVRPSFSPAASSTTAIPGAVSDRSVPILRGIGAQHDAERRAQEEQDPQTEQAIAFLMEQLKIDRVAAFQMLQDKEREIAEAGLIRSLSGRSLGTVIPPR